MLGYQGRALRTLQVANNVPYRCLEPDVLCAEKLLGLIEASFLLQTELMQ